MTTAVRPDADDTEDLVRLRAVLAPRRATAGAAAGLVLAAALTGCGGDSGDSDNADRPNLEGSSSSDPAPSSEPGTPSAPSGDDATPQGKPDDVGNDVYPRKITAQGADAEAVAEAWLDYWRTRIASYGAAEVLPEMGAVATDEAMSDVVNYVETLRTRNLHTEGDLVIDVDQIKVDGETATLHSCMDNYSTDRDAKGKPVELLLPFYDATGALVLQDGAWRVSSVEITTSGGKCS